MLLQPASPDVGSLPWNANPTGWFHQLSLSGGRADATPVMAGAVTSTLITAVFLVVLRSCVSWTSHATRRPVVSVVMVCGRQVSEGTGWAVPGS